LKRVMEMYSGVSQRWRVKTKRARARVAGPRQARVLVRRR
jgi:hypothetical protein